LQSQLCLRRVWLTMLAIRRLHLFIVSLTSNDQNSQMLENLTASKLDYTATIFLRQRWTDERLCFEGNKSLSLDGRLVEMLWVPDTFIVDSKKSFLHDITVENRLIRIYPNGTILYAIRITATVACNMDLTKCPMDKQTCTLQLESWGYNINDVQFYWTRGNDSVRGLETLRLAQYAVEDHFTSVSEAVYETGRYPKLVFHFELKRNILYFILETYVPSILLVVLSWVSFWISQSSVPARICIGVTTVLTMTTLMMGARTSLPNANCFIKAIDVYLGICFSFIFGALLEYAVAHFCTLHLFGTIIAAFMLQQAFSSCLAQEEKRQSLRLFHAHKGVSNLPYPLRRRKLLPQMNTPCSSEWHGGSGAGP
uniref:Gamma-aminobutyric acid receptor subunit pi n=1 Tax=Gopherus evgoodei TaxID=1825980 RepID=A0A8C4YK36_9SAUR